MKEKRTRANQKCFLHQTGIWCGVEKEMDNYERNSIWVEAEAEVASLQTRFSDEWFNHSYSLREEWLEKGLEWRPSLRDTKLAKLFNKNVVEFVLNKKFPEEADTSNKLAILKDANLLLKKISQNSGLKESEFMISKKEMKEVYKKTLLSRAKGDKKIILPFHKSKGYEGEPAKKVAGKVSFSIRPEYYAEIEKLIKEKSIDANAVGIFAGLPVWMLGEDPYASWHTDPTGGNQWECPGWFLLSWEDQQLLWKGVVGV